ncbi:hypothetical protein EYA84_02100 [Verrucosispora sp. SN26_14.1]|uniref:hypothetical protein n=1 Tax=Verrucosispora sp. SN26_14.1 TaxID=2527879 RepID=UPI001033137E|nr:hypothetical protein [Verrucosispora sp. SN26_14.1]TBL44256.1 hypothetical protein EYA84_02100 [Verrucosispora sp. SN26_14.1]
MARALKVCAAPGCPTLVAKGRCGTHARQTDQARGTRQQRGYGPEHEAERRRWQPDVEAGRVDCHATTCVMPSRRIQPGQDWDLDHTDDRRGYRGPSHAPCNRGWRRDRATHP